MTIIAEIKLHVRADIPTSRGAIFINIVLPKCAIPLFGSDRQLYKTHPSYNIVIQGGPEKNGTAYFPQYVDAITGVNV